jgi:hypothetical protein
MSEIGGDFVDGNRFNKVFQDSLSKDSYREKNGSTNEPNRFLNDRRLFNLFSVVFYICALFSIKIGNALMPKSIISGIASVFGDIGIMIEFILSALVYAIWVVAFLALGYLFRYLKKSL